MTRYQVIAGLEQDLHGMMTRPSGFMYDEAERSIVQTAVEITGLTALMADIAALYSPDTPIMLALRRYAELALSEDGVRRGREEQP